MKLSTKFFQRISTPFRWLGSLLLATPLCLTAQSLEKDFITPPNEAKPIMIWQWMDGVVSEKGITADLEAYKEAGIGGVQQFHVGGPLQTLISDTVNAIGSESWQRMMRFALDECHRLGLTFGTHNCPGWSSSAYPTVAPEYSMQKVVWTDTVISGKKKLKLGRPAIEYDYYEDIAVLAFPAGDTISFSDIKIIDSKPAKGGYIECSVPKGQWRVYRFGHTSNGKTNWSTASVSGTGLECDKMSREALDHYWASYPQMLFDIAGDYAGGTFCRIEIDSYEAGGQGWSKVLPGEFLKRKGYDITPWLPAIAGLIIDSKETTKKFKDDWRDVVTDLVAENYYGYMSELIHQHPGMVLLAQPYGTGGSSGLFSPIDTRKAIAQLAPDDIVCTEFWTNPVTWGWPQLPGQVDEARRGGHDIVFAEGFTCWPLHAWKDDPTSLKIIADKAFCHGVNSIMLHAGAQNPWPDAKPGMTFGMWGTQWTPGQTWWQSGGAKSLFSYMAHCQALLQKGHCVDDFRSKTKSLTSNIDGIEWTHRRYGDYDIYFVSNPTGDPVNPIISILCAGRVPEIWDPESLSITVPEAWSANGKKTDILLPLQPNEAKFIVFSKEAKTEAPGMSVFQPEVLALTEFTNPWTVRFPAESGAPAEITLTSLMPLNEHDSAGVKYFSGTCTYSTTFNFGATNPDQRYILDLGEVNNLAKVSINGTPCADLWHAPFIADITEFLTTGENTIEIDVTNLWVNRLIGDEQYPDDIEWGEPEFFGPGGKTIGRFMKTVPDWLHDGTPRPSADRKTVVSFKYFDKDSELVPSGLVGPVVIKTQSAQTDSVTVFMIGDSTMANKSTKGDNQERGWGQMLPLFLKSSVKVENYAKNGRSSKSFIDEGLWDIVISKIKPGDYLIIQFGHNDEKDDEKLHTTPGGTFDANLTRFIRETRAKGATPILMNSIVRRTYPPTLDTPFSYTYEVEGSKLMDSHGNYAVAPRKVAKKEKVHFVDMTKRTAKFVSELGPEKSKDLYMWIPRYKYDFCPKGKVDNTHLKPEGATAIADIAVDGICEVLPEFERLVKPDVRFPANGTIRIAMPNEYRPVLATAIEMFAGDMLKVLNANVENNSSEADADIVIDIAPGTVNSPQGFAINVTDSGKLKIIAHDSHGAAYGLLEISRLAGVSPWEWWADATPASKAEVVIPGHYASKQSPSVEYRGIFINDEDWGLMPWSYQTYDPQKRGVVGPKTTAKIFELLLRLRANTYWPPMHECTQPFFLTDGNREMAEKYGIYIGGSHCEPMACSTAGEWPRRGEGDYDYMANADNVRKFWQSRLDDVAGQEIIYTLGMRGVHDGAMQGAKGVEQQKQVLTQVLADQRKMLSAAGLSKAPQVFIPYKEVLDIYNAGLNVPDDVTLMWCDDNYGYIRHFPTPEERARSGGNGIYYHISYWGRPHDYLWLGTFSPGLLYQQMYEAYTRGIDRMWILNVGDIKPAEYQIELFMDMAWDIDRVRHLGVERHCGDFLAREFGDDAAEHLMPVMREHYRLAHIRKPEMMGGTRTEERDRAYWGTIHSLPWSDVDINTRLNSYNAISDSVETYASMIAPGRRDEYFQLVKYPVQAAAEMNKKLLYGQLARQGKADWSLSHAAYDSIQALTAIYNEGYDNHGKWRYMMDSHPRKLPVFDCLDDSRTEPDTMHVIVPVIKLRGTDGKGYTHPCEWLGYENSAVNVCQGDTLRFTLNALPEGEATVDIRLLPTHSVDGAPLTFGVKVDGQPHSTLSYSTQGRSETWKENVLNNQSSQKIKIKSTEAPQTIEIYPISPNIIVDQLLVY